MSSPVYVLVSNKWASYLYNNFDGLRKDEVLCDVTLQGSDGPTHLAHSCVLAASSSVLKSCLVQAPRGHYVVKIPSVTAHIWELLLNFMYEGKVKITGNERQDFLGAAQMLGLAELQGLCEACVAGIPDEKPAPPVYSVPSTSNEEVNVPEEITVMDDIGGGVDEDNGNNDSEIDYKAETEHGLFIRKKSTTGRMRNQMTRYTCTQCGKSFPWGKALHVHELMHKQKTTMKHQCSHCSKIFYSYHSLRAHERTHSYQPYKCEECNLGFHFQVNYDLHMKKKHNLHDNDQHTCSICQKDFAAKGLLQRHMSTAHGLKKKPKSTKSSTSSKSVSGNWIETCGECNTCFKTKRQLEGHFKEQHGVDKPLYCEVCENGYASDQTLTTHYKVHMGNEEGGIKCNFCGRFFKHKYALKIHESEMHDVKTEPKCDICGLQVKTLRLLGKHMRVHEGQLGEYLWKCNICGAEYDNRPDFSMHVAEHRGEKTYTCKYCNKGFIHKGNYHTHMQRHLGIKPFICNICNKSFVRKDDMKSHMRVHTGEKPFDCQVCKMKFSCISNLREHERAKHNVSFSKRNPNITVPRQQRNRVKYRSKNVAQVEINDGNEELLHLVTGAFSHEGVQDVISQEQNVEHILLPNSADGQLCTVNYEVITEHTAGVPLIDTNQLTSEQEQNNISTISVLEEGEVTNSTDQAETCDVVMEVQEIV